MLKPEGEDSRGDHVKLKEGLVKMAYSALSSDTQHQRRGREYMTTPKEGERMREERRGDLNQAPKGYKREN